jgi:hypothetical protein
VPFINHARTVLLNIAGPVPGGSIPGEEYVPSYNVLNLPPYLTAIYRLLFSSNPDSYYLYYRARQYMTLLHASPLVDFILALDSRITYSFFDDSLYVGPSLYLPKGVQLTNNQGVQIAFSGIPVPPDTTGQMYFAYIISVVDGTTLTLTESTPPFNKLIIHYQVASGMTVPVVLPGSGYSVSVTPTPGSVWSVTILNRPLVGLAGIVSVLLSLSPDTLTLLFGNPPVEPYLTFRSLWRDSHQPALMLAALLTAFIYRAEGVRLGSS